MLLCALCAFLWLILRHLEAGDGGLGGDHVVVARGFDELVEILEVGLAALDLLVDDETVKAFGAKDELLAEVGEVLAHGPEGEEGGERVHLGRLDALGDLDLLLAGKTATFYDHVEWELAKNMPRATLEPKLAEVLKKIGKVKSVKLTQQSKCDDNQCFTFELTSANGKETATFELSFNIAEWQVSEFNLAPPQ